MTRQASEFWERLIPFECEGLVRIGSRFDGGYVHSLRTVQDSRALLSFGIDINWDFEKDFQKLSSCKTVHAYDYTISKWRFFSSLAQETKKKIRGSLTRSPKKRHVMKRLELLAGFYTTFSEPNAFFQQKISSRSSREEATVADCLKRLASFNGKIFLKCDIEGSEYEIIDELVNFSNRFSGLVIEFHDVDQSPEPFMQATEKLQKKYYCVHTHINNCGDVNFKTGVPELVEMSFNNLSYAKNGLLKSSRVYPVPGLDFPNTPLAPDISIVPGVRAKEARIPAS